MAVYYVSTTGSDSNAGTSAATPFRTLGKVVAVEAAGDVCYIAPGWYRETLTLTASGTAGNLITWIADVQGAMTLSQPGRVIISARTVSGGATEVLNPPVLDFKNRSFRRFEYIIFMGGYNNAVSASGTVAAIYEQVQFYGCSFLLVRAGAIGLVSAVRVDFNEGGTPATTGLTFSYCTFSGPLGTSYKSNTIAEYNLKIVIDRCIMLGGSYATSGFYHLRVDNATTPNYTAFGITIQNCFIIATQYGIDISYAFPQATCYGVLVQNSLIQGASSVIGYGVYNQEAKLIFRNCAIVNGADLANYVSAQNFSYAFDLLLEGFHDYAVAKKLADVGVRTNLFARVEPPDTLAPYTTPASETNITLSPDLYGNDNTNTCRIIPFVGTVTNHNSYWGNPTGICDTGAYTTAAYGSSQGTETSGYLEVAGTAGLGTFDPGTIQAVYARLYMRQDGNGTVTTAYKVYTAGRAETLASGTITLPVLYDTYSNPRYANTIALSAPAGGWSASIIANLVARFWKTSAAYGSSNINQLEIIVVGTKKSEQYIGPVSPVATTKAVKAATAGRSGKTLWGPASVGQVLAVAGALGAQPLSNSTNKAGNIFVLPAGGTISRVGFYISAKNGTPPAFNVGLVTLDSSGIPTTTPYGGSAITSYTPTSTGWKWISLSTPATVSAGGVCAVVIYPGASAPDGTNNISVVSSSFATPGHAVVYSFGAWGATQLSTAMAVGYTTGAIYGYALSNHVIGLSLRSNTTPDEAGAKLTLPSTATCFGGRFAVEFYGWGASATFDLVLYDANNNVVASGSISDKDFVAKSGYVDVYWPPVVLSANAVYRLILKPTTGTGGEIYLQRYSMESIDAMRMWPCGDTWQGTSRTDAGPWSDVATDTYYMALWLSDVSFSEVAMASIFEGLPLNAEIIGTDCAELTTTPSGRFVLAFDDTAAEYADWTRKIPPSTLGSAITLYISYAMASATSGTLAFKAEVEKITPGASVNINTGHVFDTANLGAMTVPAVAGYPQELAIPLTNRASMTEGDVITIRLTRDVANDSCSGDCYVTAIEVRNT